MPAGKFLTVADVRNCGVVASRSDSLGGATPRPAQSEIDARFPVPSVTPVDENAAREQLSTIRTLMERSAVYRRALGPVMSAVGIIGTVAGLAALGLVPENARAFAFYWLAVAAVSVVVAFLLVRKQAFASGEAFWSPPTRRIAAAMLPPVFAGAAVVGPLVNIHREGSMIAVALPPFWLVLYGCALHSAGFFMVRGIRLFGWAFVVAGLLSALTATNPQFVEPSIRIAHLLMTVTFGLGHLAYGAYLHVTEKRQKA